jgi:hypothetical protein
VCWFKSEKFYYFDLSKLESSKVKVVLTELKPLKGFNSVSTTFRTAFRKEKQM